jgi:N-acetylneuraminate synthase
VSFKIKDINIGPEFDPVVIAEIGINHGGSLSVAKKMVDTAIDSGIRLIKHQTHIVEDEMSPQADKFEVGYIGKSIFSLMDDCALNESEECELMNYTLDKGGVFIITPFSRAAADRLYKFDVPAFKIGSGECNNYPLIKHISKMGKPIILSTGMNTLDSVSPAVDIIRSYGVPYALLHTTNIYPTPPHLVRLGAMTEISQRFPDAIIGLSDHTVTNHACFGAVALGACILERHFTDSMSRNGPDIICSMDGPAAKELVEGSKLIAQERGGSKGPVDEEATVIEFAFSSVVAIQDIKIGDTLDEDNLWVKRPGTGPFFAKDYDSLLGKVATSDIMKGDHIEYKHFKEG